MFITICQIILITSMCVHLLNPVGVFSTLISDYFSVRAMFDGEHLPSSFNSSLPSYAFTCDLNAHNPTWGSTRIRRKGRHLMNFATFLGLGMLNVGSRTNLIGASCSICMNVAFVSLRVFPEEHVATTIFACT